jgi:hypothetical protein
MTTATRITALCLGLFAATQAKPIQFPFESPDSLDASSLRAWWFPRQASERRSPAHQCTVKRDSIAALSGKWSAKVAFVLDGKPYPSAGIGFQFPEGASLDLRGLTNIRLKLRTDRPRKIRISIGSQVSEYAIANDTGVNLGYSVQVKDSLFDLTIPVNKLAYPQWARPEPPVSNGEVLSLASAIQITTSGDSAAIKDSGWIKIDDIVLDGVDDAPPPPPVGRCQGSEGILLSDFATEPTKRNVFGGWWYAYTDSSSSDPLARGHSLFRDSSGNWATGGWMPNAASHDATASFWLRRGGPYSGYGALETQFAPTAGEPRTLPGLHSVRFRVTIPQDFPDSQATLVYHVKKAGRDYQNGRDHQVLLPTTAGTSAWCIALDSLEQPDWVGLWKQPFTPDSLLTMSWEVRLGTVDTSTKASFTLDSVMLYGWKPTGIATRVPSQSTLRWSWQGKDLRLSRSTVEAAEVTTHSASGQVLTRQDWPQGETSLTLPGSRTLRVLRVRTADRMETLLLPALQR